MTYYHITWLLNTPKDAVEILSYSETVRITHQYRWFHSFSKVHSKPTPSLSDEYYLFKTKKFYHPKTIETPKIRSRVRIAIHVFAWKRSRSLSRLLNSLNSADYNSNHVIDLIVHVDGNPTDAVLKVLNEFEWKFGNESKIIKRQSKNIGLKRVYYQSLYSRLCWTRGRPLITTHMPSF
jgi:hypothetical protein